MKLFETLEKQLKKENDFVTEDGELKKWVVLNKAQKFDAKLIELLLDNKDLKESFFIEVKGVLVFKQNLFLRFLEQKNYLNDSYTQYKNKVGLTIDGKYLKQRNEVALVWPFKDCILEGGQSREEDKRDEIFFNEILAQDEITQLLDPKVLTAVKVYNKEGEQDFKKFNRDAEINKKRRLPENTITDNLIIKGNNLLALHSLKKEFASKIKLIYIDPPYNTGNDGFKYNDNFNHSTWLTFMKNRLTVARELLKDDGVIFVQCDDSEQAYLKVLMDEVFGRDSFLNTISVKAKVSAGASGGGEDKKIKKNIEYIHCYYNNLFSMFQNVYKETEIDNFIKKMQIDKKSFKYTQVLISTGIRKYLKTTKDGSGEDIKIYKHSEIINKTVSQIQKEEKLNIKQVYKKYFTKIYTTTNAQTSIRQRVWDAVGDGNIFYSIEYMPKSGRDKGKIITQYYTGNKKVLLIWFKNTAIIDRDGFVIKKEKYGTFWDGINYNNLNKEGDTVFSSGKKPEQIIERIINMATQPNDLVLDFHLGSGTTAAVAHKMNRQYIGIEQMDYIETVAVERLKKVIGKNVKKADELLASLEFDTGGISKSVAWKGGGAFTYLELKKHNQTFIEQIQKAKNSKALLQIWQEMKAKSFLNYNIDLQKQEEHIGEFQQLKLSQQKEHLFELLDKNQLYVNLSSINDKDFALSEAEKKLTKDFYH